VITALRNVVDNALRHGGDGNMVAVRVRRGAGTVSFIVEDDGPGMDAKDTGQATERFWRKGRGRGSGLGLSIVDAIVTRHGGTFELAPRPGGGLAATITLPAA
jgi:signal transduction histidine kinase